MSPLIKDRGWLLVLVAACSMSNMACGKSVKTKWNAGSSQAQTDNPGNGASTQDDNNNTPDPGTGDGEPKIRCVAYNLADYFRKQGCDLDPVTYSDAFYIQLRECGMKLPDDFGSLPAVGVFFIKDFNIAAQSWQNVIPGLMAPLSNRKEWYGISCSGSLSVSRSGSTLFNLMSDDGARFFVDGRLVVDNDGMHEPRSRSGIVDLTEGVHHFTLNYYQGPRVKIALQLSWERPQSGLSIIGSESFLASDPSMCTK